MRAAMPQQRPPDTVKAERQKAAADEDLADAEKALERANAGVAKAQERRLKAAAKATEAGTKFDAAKADATAKNEASDKAADAAKEAATRKVDTAKAAEEAKLALEPVSIYISRAKQMLYVRRNTHKAWPDGGEVFDASIEVPVTIRDPDKPIGTHVFTAMARTTRAFAGKWSRSTTGMMPRTRSTELASRRTFSIASARRRCRDPRSSSRTSRLSRETNYRTEFVAVLSNQPQGGFKTRRPTVSTVPEGATSWQPGFFGFFSQPSQNTQSRDDRRRRRRHQGKPGLFW